MKFTIVSNNSVNSIIYLNANKTEDINPVLYFEKFNK